MSITARTLITQSLDSLGVFAPGESIPASGMSDAFRRLNQMISSWSQQNLTIPTMSILTFDLVADKGGLDDPYLIGDGATGDNFDTQKPSNQSQIRGAALVIGGTDPEVEIPYAILTDDAYASIQIKSLGNPYFTGLWYNPTYDDGFGRIYLWPVPDGDDNQIRLYLSQSLAQFATPTTSYTFPDGYEEAIQYQLCLRLALPYKQPVTPELWRLAVESFANIKRSNTKLVDMPQDAGLLGGNRPAYNIITGQPSSS